MGKRVLINIKMKTPKDFHNQYSKFGLVGHLLAAVSYSAQNMARVEGTVLTKKDTGDIITKKDKVSFDSIKDYFSTMGLKVMLNGEEGSTDTNNPDFLALLDGLEGTQNAINGLAHGINLAIAPYKSSLKVKDMEAAVVCNLRSGNFFAANKNGRPFKIKDGQEAEIIRKETDVYEAPLHTAYTTDVFQQSRQRELLGIFYEVLGNQPRSLDATGTRLVELLEGNIRAYGDWRAATKCWDVLPSAFILQRGRFKITGATGFEFKEAIFYDERIKEDNGLNRSVGQDFIAANPEDHEKIIFGKGCSVWGLLVNELGGPAPLRKPGDFYQFGRKIAICLQGNIDEARSVYGHLVKKNVEDIVKKVRANFVDVIPEISFPEDGPLHLMKFDHVMSWMTDYDFGLNPRYVNQLEGLFV